MAELQFEAPLAKLEEAEDWGHGDVKTTEDINLNLNLSLKVDNVKQCLCSPNGQDTNVEPDNFTETFSGSLEDLVNTFDDKITRCFCNYDESVEKLAPVQVRSQEEIMNECQ